MALQFKPSTNSLYTNPPSLFGEFRANGNDTYQFTDKNGLTYMFAGLDDPNDPGRLIEIRDLHGNELLITSLPSNTDLPATVESIPAGFNAATDTTEQLVFTYAKIGGINRLSHIDITSNGFCRGAYQFF